MQVFKDFKKLKSFVWIFLNFKIVNFTKWTAWTQRKCFTYTSKKVSEKYICETQ